MVGKKGLHVMRCGQVRTGARAHKEAPFSFRKAIGPCHSGPCHSGLATGIHVIRAPDMTRGQLIHGLSRLAAMARQTDWQTGEGAGLIPPRQMRSDRRP